MSKDELLEKRILAYSYTNAFLIDFLAGTYYPYMPYLITHKSTIETLLGIELTMPLQYSYIYPHKSYRMLKRLLLREHELYLLVLEILIVVLIDDAMRGTFLSLAVFVACAIDWIVCKLLYFACKRNICAKTLLGYNLF